MDIWAYLWIAFWGLVPPVLSGVAMYFLGKWSGEQGMAVLKEGVADAEDRAYKYGDEVLKKVEDRIGPLIAELQSIKEGIDVRFKDLDERFHMIDERVGERFQIMDDQFHPILREIRQKISEPNPYGARIDEIQKSFKDLNGTITTVREDLKKGTEVRIDTEPIKKEILNMMNGWTSTFIQKVEAMIDDKIKGLGGSDDGDDTMSFIRELMGKPKNSKKK